LQALIKLGKSRGYLTYAEINDHLPDDMVDVESLETLVATLNDIGVAVYEQAPAKILTLCLGRDVFIS
jgi:RNA polymerase primary sigma factor